MNRPLVGDISAKWLHYVIHLEDEITRLREGACRFNCRTNSEAFRDGWNEALRASGAYRHVTRQDMEDALNEWKSRNKAKRPKVAG